jgi:hypothetical protein
MPTGGVAAVGGTLATGGSGGAGGAAAAAECVFLVPQTLAELSGTTFFDHPWPSDFRLDSNGMATFTGFPNLLPSAVLSTWLTEVDASLPGFSPAAPGYLRFTAPLDLGSLPADPGAARSAGSSVQLIDVDPTSPDLGARRLVSLSFRTTGDAYYWPDNTLAFMPTVGYPLREDTRYALVVTRAATAGGVPLGVCAGLRQVLDLDPATGTAAALRDAWADAIGRVESAGIPRASIAHLTVFTTNHPTQLTRELRDWVVTGYQAPDLVQITGADQTAGVVDNYTGSYGPSPDFQAGVPPFLDSGGNMVVDANGNPVVQRELELRVSLSVPRGTACPMPVAGYPVVLYGHGTGGNYRTVVTSGFAEFLATHCLASVGIDLVLHGTRPGGPCAALNGVEPCNHLTESWAIFNPYNPTSVRNTNRQGAIDLVQLARLVKGGKLAVPAGTSYTGQPVVLDASRLLYLAHSQGAVSGMLTMAVDDQLWASAQSGSAAMATLSLLERSQPANLAALIVSYLYPAGSSATLDIFHPVMSLLQATLDEADPLHYAAAVITQPRPGFAPKGVLHVEGVGANGESDSYVSSHAIEVEALALGLPPLSPMVRAIPEYAWTDLSPVQVPSGGLAANLAGGRATGALVQWEPPPVPDGGAASEANDPHFVIFYVPRAYTQAAVFLRSFVTEPLGRIPPP